VSATAFREAARPFGAGAAATALGAAVLVAVLAAGSAKLALSVLGLGLLLAGAWLSGNPRLLWIWGLTVTLPLNLSKKFGPILDMGGGENTFRVEVSDVFMLFLAAAILRDHLAGRRPALRVPRVLALWGVIAAMGVASMFVVPWPRVTAFELVRMVRMALLFLVVCNELDRPRRMLHAAAGLTLGLLVNAVAGVLQYVRHANLGLEVLGETSERTIEVLALTSVQGARVWRSSGFLLHPNIFGIFLASLLPLAIGAFLVARSRAGRVFYLASVSLGLAALIATQSRSGWVSFAAGAALLMSLMVLHPGMRRRSLVTLGVAVVALLIVLAVFRGPIMARLFESQDVATIGREEFKADARRMIAASPVFGHGLNSYVHAVPPYMKYRPRDFEYWIPPVHQIYYLWTAETGFVGLAIHLALWGLIAAAGIGNLKVRDELLFTVNAACLAGMLAFSVDGFFSFSLRVNSALKVWWVLAGLIMAIRGIRRARPQLVPAPPA
jgi:O-antigen ligase